MPLPPPGTFRLYPFAEPPLPAGRYTLTGDVTGLPGPVETMSVTVDVVAPRYALPPDQILSTFPPASARGSFTSRLPQIVLRRRTLPWERSPDLVPGGTPTPWLALVLIAEGEGQLLNDVPVEACVTSGFTLDSDRDVPKGACLVVPETVVRSVFPTREDLAMLTHVREVDISDTELAMGDDDGWMAVVLCNRLPQANTRYLACLINLEGQYDELPDPANLQVDDDYDRSTIVMDIRELAGAVLATGDTADRAIMGLPGAAPVSEAVLFNLAALSAGESNLAAVSAGEEAQAPAIRSATGTATPTGAGWAATTGRDASATLTTASATSGATVTASAAKLALGDGFSFSPESFVRSLRFPTLAYWSFTCEERGDFQYLAEHVHSRLLGHVPAHDVSETPDGDPIPAGGSAPPPGARPEPANERPLPLVAETGHVSLPAVTRRGDATDAWFRGPLAPMPVERAVSRPDGSDRPPLAHHSDQLRRVVPDGREDLGYSAGFEIGRLLALSQPGVAATMARWRQEAFGAARVRSATTEAVANAPTEFRERVVQPDPLTDDTGERLLAQGAGRRSVRALFDLLGSNVEAIAPSRPLGDPGTAAADLRELVGGDRDGAVVRGLGVERAVDGIDLGNAPAVANILATAPAQIAGERRFDSEVTVLRAALESEAGRIAENAVRVERLEQGTFKRGGPQ
jgi:hypothetical protein